MRDKRQTRSARLQLETMEERAVTSSFSFNLFTPTVALHRATATARANAVHAAAMRAATLRTAAMRTATANRFGPTLVTSSASRVTSTAPAHAAAVTHTVARTSPATVARPAATNADISDVKNGPLAKAGQELINLYVDYQAFVNAGGQGTFRSAHAPTVQVVGTSVRLAIKGTGGAASALAGMGMTIESTDPHTGIFTGLLPIAQLPNAAQLSEVTMIRAVHYPRLA